MVDFNEWDMKLSEWRGYVLRALEDVNQELIEIKKNQNTTNQNIEKLNNRLNSLHLRVATIGGTTGLIVTLITLLISRLI